MNGLYVLLSMVFCHIVDDYYLQGKLALFKQKSWWEEKAPDEMYKYDYIVALMMHSFSWAFMVMLSVAVSQEFQIGAVFVTMFIINTVVHAIVDDLKANKRKINLVTDQSIHISQIIVTFLICMLG